MINFLTSTEKLTDIENSCIVIGIFEDEKTNYKEINQLLDENVFVAKLGKTQYLVNVSSFKSAQIILLGLGKKDNFTENYYQKAILALMSCVKDNNIKSLTLATIAVDNKDKDWVTSLSVRLIQNSLYVVQKIYKEQEKAPTLVEVILQTNNNEAIKKAQAIASGMSLTRELADLPSNICTPSYLAKVSEQLAKEHKLEIEILEEEQMAKLGMNSLLSVAKGSIEKPKLISIHYKNDSNEQPIVLVGKGVTFDSGGISLKGGSGMDEMKYDMCGAASVLGVMKAIATMGLKVNLTVVIATVENMPAGNASKPGDVVKSMSGQTIEILNTDAEGRMILCDALTYVAKFKPKVVIDIATLTGAVIVALGRDKTGLMSNDENLAKALSKAGEDSLDNAWRLPINDTYDKLLDSNFADMANIGGGEAGSVTAACFLARFTRDYKWAHLDIAGTAWVTGKAKGATGRPVPLLTQYVMDSI